MGGGGVFAHMCKMILRLLAMKTFVFVVDIFAVSNIVGFFYKFDKDVFQLLKILNYFRTVRLVYDVFSS